jgi:hypothetical protein
MSRGYCIADIIKNAKCILFFQEREKCRRILGNNETLAASFAN